MALQYRDGAACDGKTTDSDMAREPRSEAVIAYFDGWGQSQGMPPMTYSRRLNRDELASWREGFAEGKTDTREWANRQMHAAVTRSAAT